MSVVKPYVGRLAPSPTGALHLGNVRTFLIAYLRARSQGGKVILRIEDLDHPRDKKGAEVALREDLAWLGFSWDEEYTQSARRDIYRSARDFLLERGFIYPCVCSRRDVEAAQSAPHAGEQLFYAGRCRDRFASWEAAFAAKGAMPCWRFRVEKGETVSFEDGFAGVFSQDVAATLGDFPLARDEDGAGYTLAATVDDLLMGVTEVVRGDDLLPATPAQILLARALVPWVQSHFSLLNSQFLIPNSQISIPHSPLPTYFHVPLVVGADGKRLAKRHGDTRIASFRAQGVRPEAIIGRLAATCGWAAAGEEIALDDLIPRFSPASIPRYPICLEVEEWKS